LEVSAAATGVACSGPVIGLFSSISHPFVSLAPHPFYECGGLWITRAHRAGFTTAPWHCKAALSLGAECKDDLVYRDLMNAAARLADGSAGGEFV
jgi:hypothetical protein